MPSADYSLWGRIKFSGGGVLTQLVEALAEQKKASEGKRKASKSPLKRLLSAYDPESTAVVEVCAAGEATDLAALAYGSRCATRT
eukprot:2490726-Pyramimonas_sp.AAC.1